MESYRGSWTTFYGLKSIILVIVLVAIISGMTSNLKTTYILFKTLVYMFFSKYWWQSTAKACFHFIAHCFVVKNPPMLLIFYSNQVELIEKQNPKPGFFWGPSTQANQHTDILCQYVSVCHYWYLIPCSRLINLLLF